MLELEAIYLMFCVFESQAKVLLLLPGIITHVCMIVHRFYGMATAKILKQKKITHSQS